MFLGVEMKRDSDNLNLLDKINLVSDTELTPLFSHTIQLQQISTSNLIELCQQERTSILTLPLKGNQTVTNQIKDWYPKYYPTTQKRKPQEYISIHIWPSSDGSSKTT